MSELISEETLVSELNKFRDVLLHYDYSDVKNVIFFNVKSLNAYIRTYRDNPFEKQYQDLEAIFNKIIPYIPSNIPEEAINTITHILDPDYENKEAIKRNILFNIKMDFIETVKNVSSESQWQELLNLCKDIRLAKAHYLTH